jgi:hypothetical protein
VVGDDGGWRRDPAPSPVDHGAVAVCPGAHLVHLAVVDDAAVEGDQAIAAPHLAVPAIAREQRHHQDLDLTRDRGLDHQIIALTGERDDVLADLAVGLVMDRVLRALRRIEAGERRGAGQKQGCG